VIDPKREELLVKEANRLKIPVVALTDTNCDPDMVDYVIPGNDDAIRSIDLIARLIADAILEGRGEDVTAPEERPMPPAVEDALVAEDEATEPLSEAASEGGLADDQPTGLADPVESAGEIAPEEDPTTSYRGDLDRQEQSDDADLPVADATTADEPDVPEAGRASSGDAEGVPGGGSLRPGEETALSEGDAETAASEDDVTAEPGGEAERDEADENNEPEEK
jgi:small subunit ribosomal protein S2